MIVEWNKPNSGIKYIPVQKDSLIVGHIVLSPGQNEVKDDLWEAAKKNIEKEPEKEWIKFLVDEEGEPRKLSDLPPEKAIEVVKDTWSLPSLKKWRSDEARDEVRVEIKEQEDRLQD